MSISGIGSSSMVQWLQSYLSNPKTPGETQAACGCQHSSDSASISQDAIQQNANQALQSLDPSQASGASATQGHHHHRHHHGSGQQEGNFVSQLAQAIATDLQQASGNTTSADASVATGDTPAQPVNSTGDSFVTRLADLIAHDLLAQYQQQSQASTSASSTSTGNQVPPAA
ncbi:MAG: hypothetical protein KF814_02990 [Nitrospiraceae bacterium]|nr:hypothetical protein [Nitrospiraceae bacterium]